MMTKSFLKKTTPEKEDFDVFCFTVNINKLVLPESVDIIDQSLLSNSPNFNKIDIPMNSRLCFIGDNSFANTKISSISLLSSLDKIGCKAFSNTKNSNISLISYLNEINSSAFSDCLNLYKVSIQEDSKLQIIGDQAFQNTSISCFYVPRNVTFIGYGAFDNLFFTIIEFAGNPNFEVIDIDRIFDIHAV